MQHTKSQTRTARLLGLSFDQVHRVMKRAVDRGMQRRSPVERYYYLSIDEKAVKAGQHYISILSDEASGIVIEVVSGRSKESVDNLCSNSLSQEQRSDVKTICTDMWEPFIYAASVYYPKAKHCHDNFHLVGYLNKAVDKIRRREVKNQAVLKKTKYLWLKDRANMTDNQKLKFDTINKVNYQVAQGWRIKENFRDIQFRQSATQAEMIYKNWVQNAYGPCLPEINDVVQMFERHRQGIINAIETGANNARAERVNGSIQELKTIGRGYRNEENFRIAILFFHGGLDLYSH